VGQVCALQRSARVSTGAPDTEQGQPNQISKGIPSYVQPDLPSSVALRCVICREAILRSPIGNAACDPGAHGALHHGLGVVVSTSCGHRVTINIDLLIGHARCHVSP
jgi:hypothetical protein